MSNEFTFVVEKKCPVCGKNTRVVKVKSRLMISRTDDDYCTHYRDFNPYFYTIWACEHCGYAADEKHFLSPLSGREQEIMAKFLHDRRARFLFTPERGLPEAIASFQLAIYCAEAISAPPSRLASLSLHMAWVFRTVGLAEQEREWTKKAVALFDRSLMTERYPVENLSDNAVTYLIATLYNRLGERERCTQYLGMLINDKKLKMNNEKLYNDARRLWQTIRSDEAEATKAAEQAVKRKK